MNVRYRVELSQAERDQLTGMLSGGKHAARKLKRAQILLSADIGMSDAVIAAGVCVGESTVYRTKRRFVEGNLALALSEEPRPGSARKLSGKEEALLIATACSNPPEGRARWTLELLAGEMVKRTEHTGLSRETVRRRLKENQLKPWQQDMWCICSAAIRVVTRVASPENAPERPRRCLIRMLPRHHQNVNRCQIGLSHLNGLGQDKAPAFLFDRRACFPVPTWRRHSHGAQRRGMGGAEPPGATRSALLRASMARMASTGPSPK
jgi:transposase